MPLVGCHAPQHCRHPTGRAGGQLPSGRCVGRPAAGFATVCLGSYCLLQAQPGLHLLLSALLGWRALTTPGG